jgi:hypothetical protein
MDAQARRVITRAEAAYRKLKSLRTISRDGGSVAISLLARPKGYHHLQKRSNGQVLALAVSNGTQYYEYREQTRQYVERPTGMLDRLALPMNTRLFFPGQTASGVLIGLDGSPTVREYEYHYVGKTSVKGKPVERVDVSVMVRGAGNVWHAFRSERYFEIKSGLLIRGINGRRVLDIENQPDIPIPAERFQWVAPAGSTKGLG